MLPCVVSFGIPITTARPGVVAVFKTVAVVAQQVVVQIRMPYCVQY